MGKNVCEVCGAAYPESSNRCPTCGSVRNSVPTPITPTRVNSGNSKNGAYVQGGRYSKSNVRKRKRQQSGQAFNKEYVKYIAVGIALLLLLILLLSLIIKSCTGPSGGNTTGSETSSETTQDTTESTPLSIPCTNITLNAKNIYLDGAGATFKLSTFLVPMDTTDNPTFASNDLSIATVDDDGTITAMGNGTAVITVTCGNVTATCEVKVTIPEPTEEEIEYKISIKDVTLRIGVAGSDRFSLYLRDPDGNKMPVEWVASKDGIVTIKNNTIKAVAPGTVTVKTTFEGKTYSCIVRVSRG